MDNRLRWELDVIEQLSERAFELHVRSEYDELGKTLAALTSIVCDCQQTVAAMGAD